MFQDCIRVLYLQPAPGFGGAERQAATIIPLLRAQGVDVLPLVGPGEILRRWLAQRGVDDCEHSRDFPGAWPKPRGLARAVLPLRYARCLRRMRSTIAALLEERRIDVVFAALPFSWVAATDVARQRGVPIVWRAGGTRITAAQRLALSSWSRVRRPDLLVCNAHRVRDAYAPLVRAPARVVPNGVDTSDFHPGAGDPRRYRPDGARCVVGFAGRMVPTKRPDDFIALAARTARRRRDVSFLAIGDGSRLPRYRQRARREGADTLSFLGYVDDMPSFYAACDLLVLPCGTEGCPNVVLEAMASGTAVVAAADGGCGELLHHEDDGMLYPTGDLDQLEETALRVLDDPVLRERLTIRGRQRIVDELSAVTCASTTAAIVRSVAAGRATLAGSPSAPGRALPAPPTWSGAPVPAER